MELSQPCVPVHICTRFPMQSTTLWKSDEQPSAHPPPSGRLPSMTKPVPPVPAAVLVAPPLPAACVEPPVLEVLKMVLVVAEHATATAAGSARQERIPKGERRKARGWLTA